MEGIELFYNYDTFKALFLNADTEEERKSYFEDLVEQVSELTAENTWCGYEAVSCFMEKINDEDI